MTEVGHLQFQMDEPYRELGTLQMEHDLLEVKYEDLQEAKTKGIVI